MDENDDLGTPRAKATSLSTDDPYTPTTPVNHSPVPYASDFPPKPRRTSSSTLPDDLETLLGDQERLEEADKVGYFTSMIPTWLRDPLFQLSDKGRRRYRHIRLANSTSDPFSAIQEAASRSTRTTWTGGVVALLSLAVILTIILASPSPAFLRTSNPADESQPDPFVVKPGFELDMLRPNSKLKSSPFLPEQVLNSRTMSQEQCDAMFPLFAPDLRKTRDIWSAKGGVPKYIGEPRNARVVIFNGQLFIKQFNNGIQSRTLAALSSLYEAVITSPDSLPNVELVLDTGDGDEIPSGPMWLLDRRNSEQERWLMPDFGFWSWPEPAMPGYRNYRVQTLETETSRNWTDKIDELVFRGVPFNDWRKGMIKASDEHPEWGNAKELDWGDRKTFLPILKHCDWRYVAGVEGRTYSGRLRMLGNCRSVIVTNELEYFQHWHVALNSDDTSDDQNVVYARGSSMEDLPKVMEQLRSDPDRAKRIAENGWKDLRMRYLSPASVTCWWRMALREYATVQNFEPLIDGATDYESFSLMREVPQHSSR